jgi:putative transposase
MCRLLGVSPSGYYAFQSRKPSARACSDAVLSERIEAIHAFSKGTYGAPPIHDHLRDEGIRIGRKRVARLMRAAGLEGVSRRNGYCTTKQDKAACFAPDLVNRALAADAPDRLWVADLTYVPTRSGFCILPWSWTPSAGVSRVGTWPLT